MNGRTLIAGLTLSILAIIPSVAQTATGVTEVTGVIEGTNIGAFTSGQDVEIVFKSGFGAFVNLSATDPYGEELAWAFSVGTVEPELPALSLAKCKLVFSNVPGTSTAPSPQYMFVRIELSPISGKVAAVRLCPTAAPCWAYPLSKVLQVTVKVTSIKANWID